MGSGISAVKNHPLVTYYLLALGLTWAIEMPLALVRQGVVNFSLPFSIHYIACYGPMLAAIITTSMIEGSPGVRELFGRMFKYRVGLAWSLRRALRFYCSCLRQ